jgi:hypothetical protein
MPDVLPEVLEDGEWRTLRAWDAGERRVMSGLAEHALVDVYRDLHGYAVTDSSCILRRGGEEVGRRFDHVFASRKLVPHSCEYLHHCVSSDCAITRQSRPLLHLSCQREMSCYFHRRPVPLLKVRAR